MEPGGSIFYAVPLRRGAAGGKLRLQAGVAAEQRRPVGALASAGTACLNLAGERPG